MFLLFPSSSDNHQSVRTTTLEHRPALVFQVNDFRHNKPGGKSVVHYTLSFEIELWDFGVLLIRLQIYVFAGDILACKEAVFSFPCQIYLLWELPSLFFC